MSAVEIYDTTLRDGAQAEAVSFGLDDKLRIVERLDDFGVRYVEGGWPGSNPRDEEFFRAVRTLPLRHARLAAFGSTRRPGTAAADDRNLAQCLAAATPVVTIVGKTWDLHVRDDLRIERSENLDLIRDSVSYLAGRCDEVIFDAEHFFDGWTSDEGYALDCLAAAVDGGVACLCLCDTRGGSLPGRISTAVRAVRGRFPTMRLGIHCHNDGELAVANTLEAVAAGCVQVQGTINGIGERCGNANLVSVIALLETKLGVQCVGPDRLSGLTRLSRFVDERANLEPNKRQPFVGQSAFAHKGGLHAAAVAKRSDTYEHIDPGLVGNEQRVLVSDLSGRSNLMAKAQEFGIDLTSTPAALPRLLEQVKALESDGYVFEGAEASFELMMRHAVEGTRPRFFRLLEFRVIDEKRREDATPIAEATIQLEGPDGTIEHTAAQGNGPVNALDGALRKALSKFYPEVEEVQLHDYKVRVLGSGEGTGAVVRVLIESGDGESRWGTIGVSHNVIEASWQALADSMDYKLYHSRHGRGRAARARGAVSE